MHCLLDAVDYLYDKNRTNLSYSYHRCRTGYPSARVAKQQYQGGDEGACLYFLAVLFCALPTETLQESKCFCCTREGYTVGELRLGPGNTVVAVERFLSEYPRAKRCSLLEHFGDKMGTDV